ncbi:MAG: 2-amino-4-hydroxy-6-hydroxymethyldihydropteridine diphosphokinase [Deltaproteobacteria bacterium]|nr:MAG: 2-amino-4-hydroxy-6-hydroxymethyldihydropteridine diphosphokinase [Deltaproteobacteria bacterium]
MNDVLIGLGSNIGNGLKNLMGAWQRIGQFPEVRLMALSSPYLSSPVGLESEKWFTNAAGHLRTRLTAIETLELLLEAEQEFGRSRNGTSGYQDRILDLDILFFNDMIADDDRLTIPHPRAAERKFVLAPLLEIAPAGFCHPVTGQGLEEILAALEKDDRYAGQQLIRKSWPVQESIN